MFRLAKLSLANRALIALITVFASVFGVITMSSLKQELIPSIEFPQITVITSMPGASPEVVDKQISAPLETALNGVEGLESTSSTSRNGVSQITLAFTYGSNLDRARNQIDRAISNAKRSLPDDVQPQAIAGQHQRLPDRVPGRLLGQAPQRAERRSRPAQRPAAAEARRRPRRRRDRRRHPAHPDPAPARGHGGLRREHPVHQRCAEEQRGTWFRPAPSRNRARRCRCRSAARWTRSTPSRRSRWAAARRCRDDRQRGGRQPRRGRPHVDHPDQRQGNPGPVRDQEARGRHRRRSPTRSRTPSRSSRPSSAPTPSSPRSSTRRRSSRSPSRTSPPRACWAWASPSW